MKTFFAAAAALVAASALAQGPGAGEPRTPPPPPPTQGLQKHGEPPALENAPLPGSAAPADNRARRAESRCAELSGARRSECLALEQGGGASGSTTPAPRTAPPPQNPR